MPRNPDKPGRSASPKRRSRRQAQPQDYLVKLHPWAAKLNARHASGLKLAEVLSGQTCSPISLSDFELYLVYREMSIEQLQFVVWFNDYRERVRTSKPGAVRSASISSLSSAGTSFHSKRPALTNSTFSHAIPISPLPLLNDSVYNDPALRQECMHVISTFLVPGSPKELLIDADKREQLIKGLENTCHPDLFLPVYHEVYFSLENDTLPRFLAYSLPNINLPKQILWYITGISQIIVSIMAVALMIVFIPPPIYNRAWRLLAVPFFHMGTCTVHAAFLGFCSQVFHRNAVQLHSWELRQVDEEAQAYVDAVRAAVRDDGGMRMGVLCNSADGSYSGRSKPIETERPRRQSAGHSEGYVRPPMFGPEKVIQDAHVLKAHKRVMNSIWFVGITGDIIYSAIIFSIPGHST